MPSLHKLLTGEWVDPITRLPNKEFAQMVLQELKENNELFYVMHLKLDFQVSNNDIWNFVMSRVSSVIKHSVRIPKDFVCKLDNNDFCIVLHGIQDAEVKKIADRIRDSLHYLLLTYGPEKIKIDCQIEITTVGGAQDGDRNTL
ncbi:MAG: GGDEF domain-containing protein [Fervidobacterium sp.]|uniref:GGDEF domain-containing protein, diguanylate cyclase (C-di-GMP synthetase) or its enzymatically inactive variants n=1 Tax=Fervidobacterium gondwanense DSM 13020 TaxID=1121883 RepID=A0A1M7SBT3_FERGO|nr:GGDEF domain-containing protein [Fervidobacterium gondwanense]UXF00443.1 diguanylate cyclase [Fervidobacterium riparium]SHN55915.1 GGDEF domain-containing protein, diguanylate cyclase (c-di-GMP synthetase) or its enzymatically inactive variants [Fervidobacterium gondwanense DSM 13020]